MLPFPSLPPFPVYKRDLIKKECQPDMDFQGKSRHLKIQSEVFDLYHPFWIYVSLCSGERWDRGD